MTKDMTAAPEDLAQLARNASPLILPRPEEPTNNAAKANRRLAAGLNHLRGEAVQRAKAANSRLRWQAASATALSFGIGIAIGIWGSRRRIRRALGF